MTPTLSTRALARLLSGLENGDAKAQAQLRELYPHSGQARVIGITGAPGSGKSTLVTEMARLYRAQQHTVAVIAVDPSSPFTNGAILGDRYRMNDLAGDPGVFIRSMASRGALGGITGAVFDGITALDVAGYQVILVETVGAGQVEIEVAWAAESVIVVEAPGLGDDIQAVKAGILEIADVVVVNKADRDGAGQTSAGLQAALDVAYAGRPVGDFWEEGYVVMPGAGFPKWRVPVLQASATKRAGIDAILAQLARHKRYLDSTGKGEWRREHRVEHDVLNRLREALLRRALSAIPPQILKETIAKVSQHQLHPIDAVERLISHDNTLLNPTRRDVAQCQQQDSGLVGRAIE